MKICRITEFDLIDEDFGDGREGYPTRRIYPENTKKLHILGLLGLD
ncbi:MAG: hypothetical protein ACJ74Z_11985 [Bryobacteraceae bacterium]